MLRHLATGGMAEIYLARATGIEGFEKTVVVKRMLPSLAADSECVRLFLNEARLAAQLQHANLVQVHDVGAEDGNYFIAMEFVHGVDVRAIAMRARQRGKPVPLAVALAIISDVCAGLHYAHERRDASGRPLNLVHCDISPSNIMVAFDGVAKTTDFGIAKAGGGPLGTRQSSLRGKFGYMSPEQCLGELLDRRSDVYAIALVFAELTCGTRLFTGPSDFMIMKQVTEGPPPRLSALSPGYPSALEALVLRGLARDRDARLPSAQALQVALESFGRERKLEVSSVTVSKYLTELFGDDVESLRDGGLAELTASLVSAGSGDESMSVLPPPASRARRLAPRVALVAVVLAVAASAGVAMSRAGETASPALVAPARNPSGDDAVTAAPAASRGPAQAAPTTPTSPSSQATRSAIAVVPPTHAPTRRGPGRNTKPLVRQPLSKPATTETTHVAPWDPESAAPPP